MWWVVAWKSSARPHSCAQSVIVSTSTKLAVVLTSLLSYVLLHPSKLNRFFNPTSHIHTHTHTRARTRIYIATANNDNNNRSSSSSSRQCRCAIQTRATRLPATVVVLVVSRTIPQSSIATREYLSQSLTTSSFWKQKMGRSLSMILH